MGVITTLTDETYDCEIVIESDGWSGEVLRFVYGEEEPKFQFDITGNVHGGDEYFSCTPSTGNYGYIRGNADYDGCYIGISLEHMGRIIDSDGEIAFSACGNHPYWQNGGAFGAKPTDESLRVTAGQFYVKSLDCIVRGEPSTYENHAIGRYFQYSNNVGIIFYRCDYVGSGQWTWRATIKTDLPIFATDADLLEYCRSGGTVTDKILNIGEEPDPEEEYKLDQKYYYLHNIFTHNYHGTQSKAWYNYRWKPGYDSKIRLYRVKPNDSRYYTLVLTVPGGLTRFKGPKGEYSDADAFVVDEDDLQTNFQEYSYTISRVAPRDEVTVTDFDTNIPIWGNAEDATKYANDELSIEDALNYSDILAYEQQLPEPDFGDVDVETETGINGQAYNAGSAIYVLSRTEMIAFFTEIFKIQDPSFINAFKDGNVLFGDNQANAIIGCQYFPFDASLVCSLESSSGAIWVGGWESQNATGKKVNMNDKVISVGEFFLPDMFKDFRDYEPYTNIYVQLPYCGTYQLSVQKYLNKTVKINYAVDIFTGACTALIYANNILMDSMDGMIGSQRPITGRTSANMLQAITRGSASVAAGVAGGAKGGMALAGAGEAVFAGGEGVAALGIGAGAQTAVAANALAASGIALGAAGAGIAAVAGVDMMYKAKNAYADPPMATRGQYSGNLGMFGNQKVHFIVAIRHNYRPDNELDLIGYPSGRGGKIGSFSGFLKSSSVYLADGFIGSVQERNEILQMIAKGIYI